MHVTPSLSFPVFLAPAECPESEQASSSFLQSQDPVERPLSRRSGILSGGAGEWFNFSLALARGKEG